MINRTLAVLAIVAIAAMMGAASVAPVYAATKIVNEYKNEFKDNLTGTITCGETLVDVKIERTTKMRTVIWSDKDPIEDDKGGKFTIHVTITKKFFDQGSGEQIGHFTSIDKHVGKDYDLFVSQSYQHNEAFVCLGEKDKAVDSFGFTVDKDGNLTFH